MFNDLKENYKFNKIMEYITKPSILRLAKRAGIKSLSEDSYDSIINIINNNMTDLIKVILIVNSENNNKIINKNDVYNSLNLEGYNVSYSNELSRNTFTK